MKIVLTDDFFINFGNISWKPISQSGELIRYAVTLEEELIGRIKDADAVFINRCRITRAVMAQCRNLKFIGTMGTGVDGVDLQAAQEQGITVCNVPAYGKTAVAQMAIALMLAIARNVAAFDYKMKTTGWMNASEAWICDIPQMELAGKTLGILGMGDIGYAVARIAMAMDMRVLATKRTPDSAKACEQLQFCSLDDMLANSDIISVHCPLTEETRGIIDAEAIAKMKDGAVLINTARGGVLCEQDVVAALDSGKLYAVGTDVFTQEPPGKDNPLVSHPRCVATPHAAWMPLETRQRVVNIAGENLRCFIMGEPQNQVTP